MMFNTAVSYNQIYITAVSLGKANLWLKSKAPRRQYMKLALQLTPITGGGNLVHRTSRIIALFTCLWEGWLCKYKD